MATQFSKQASVALAHEVGVAAASLPFFSQGATIEYRDHYRVPSIRVARADGTVAYLEISVYEGEDDGR